MTFLEKTKTYLEKTYTGKVLLDSIDISSNKPIKKEVPAFLFRGENRFNRDLLSSRQRFINNKRLTDSEKSEIEGLTFQIDTILRDNKLPPMWSASLLQHYNFPTEVIDATSDLDVLAGFISSKNMSGFGRIYVYPIKSLAENSIVIDLSEIDFARRPIRQKGYTIFHRKYIDLMHPVILENADVQIFEFTVTDEDIQKYNMDDYLYEKDNDSFLASLRQIVNYGAGIKKTDFILRWFQDNIVHAAINHQHDLKVDAQNNAEIVIPPEEYISFWDWKKLNRK